MKMFGITYLAIAACVASEHGTLSAILIVVGNVWIVGGLIRDRIA